jgi:hypothetical protein
MNSQRKCSRLLARFNLADYATVQERIEAFWKKYPNGSILTSNLTTADDRSRGQWVVQATVFFDRNDELAAGQGMAFEIDGTAGANQTAALENCETSAIGRALATAGFATSKHRASREEMMKTERSAPPVTAEQVEAATTLDDLNALWDAAVKSGDSTKLVSTFTMRKRALQDVPAV